MTVGELIQELNNYPQEMEIKKSHWNYATFRTKDLNENIEFCCKSVQTQCENGVLKTIEIVTI